jgi:hypothetical protein
MECQFCAPTNIRLKRYLLCNEDRGYTKLELLRLAAMYHDIGKAVVMKTASDGTTLAPGHSGASVEKFDEVAGAFDLTANQISHIKSLIFYHHDLDRILETHGTPKYQYEVSSFQETHKEIYTDLLVLFLADSLGCKTDPDVTAAERLNRELVCALLIEALAESYK